MGASKGAKAAKGFPAATKTQARASKAAATRAVKAGTMSKHTKAKVDAKANKALKK